MLLGCAKTVHKDRATMNALWLAENWQWYHQTESNPFREPLSQTAVQQLLSGWNTRREVQFSSQVLHISVRLLDEGAVYKSNLVNGKLYDMLTVNHQKKMVYLFNSTSLTPAAHPLSVKA